jgi:hypothetical protein
MAGGIFASVGSISYEFLDGLTKQVLLLGLKLNWSAVDARTALNVVREVLDMGGFLRAGADPDGGLSAPSGPHLAVSNIGVAGVRSLDLGTVVADGPGGANGSASLQLRNFGSDDLLIKQIFVRDDSGAFTATGVAPNTVLRPGDALPLQIGYDPTLGGTVTAGLQVDSNDIAGPYRIQLTAASVKPTPDIRVTVVNNNVGGATVGGTPPTFRQFGIISNIGSQPLSITGIGIAQNSYTVGGFPASPSLVNPLDIQPGESVSFDLAFTPDRIGLRPGDILIRSNDPDVSVLHQHVIGTGLAASGSAAHWGNDFVAIEMPDLPGPLVLRQKSDDGGNFSLFLPPQQRFHAAIFEPVSGLIAANLYGTTARSGTQTDLGISVLDASIAPDTDGDGLPDDIEFAIGTSPNRADTDGNGLIDFAAIEQGLDPLGGRAFPTGVIASLPLVGEAKAIVVAGSITDPTQQTAYLATGSGGLAIVDVSKFNKPLVLSRLALPGDSTDVSVDANLTIAAVAANAGGLHLVDVSDPSAPRLRQTIDAAANQLEVADGVVYVTMGSNLRAYDLATGQKLQTLDFPGVAFTGMAREDQALYLMDTARVLRVVDISGGSMFARGSLVMPQGGGKFVVGNGIAYVGAGTPGSPTASGGFITVDVNDPDHPTLIEGVDAANIEGAALAVNGSGLAVTVGALLPPSGMRLINALDVVDVSNPAKTGVFVTRIDLPAAVSDFSSALIPHDVVLASGIAFVADANAGLEVVSYLAFDTKGISPVVTVDASAADIDPSTPGVQVTEASTFAVRANIRDDVQIRNVELLINNQVVQNSVSFPFNLSVTAPRLTAQSPTVSVQVRATDSGGNTTLSDPLVIGLLADTRPPVLIGTNPSQGGKSFFIAAINLTFDEPLDPAVLNLAAVTLTNLGLDGQIGGGDDVAVAVNPPRLLALGRLLSIAPAVPVTSGKYRLTVAPAILADRAANHAAPVVLDFTVSTVRAATGTPADPSLPSANPGQGIILTGTGLSLGTPVAFNTIDFNGTVRKRPVFPVVVASGGTALTVVVPDEAVTGPVVFVGDDNDTPTVLQVVPVVSGLKFGFASFFGGTAPVTVTGKGFIEGNDTTYQFGTEVVTDADAATGPDVTSDPLSGTGNSMASVTLPFSEAVFGAVTVTTAGGTSAPFSVGFTSLTATAYSGTPADPTQPSANPGQVVTLNGTGLSAATDIVVQYILANTVAGTLRTSLLHPNFVDAGGTRATFIASGNLNGAFPVHVAGSAFAPLLQIVPVVDAADELFRGVRLRGLGFVAGHNSVYQIGTGSVTDTGIVTQQYGRPFDVEPSNAAVTVNPAPGGGPGIVRVTTVGGVSAPIAWDVLFAQNNPLGSSVTSLTFDPSSGDMLITDNEVGRIRRLNPVTAAEVSSILYPASDGILISRGLQFLPSPIILGGVAVPAGSLFALGQRGSDLRGQASAFDPTTGTPLATLLLPEGLRLLGVTFDPASGHLFASNLLSSFASEVVELNPADGLVVSRFPVPVLYVDQITLIAGAITVDPVTSNLWLVAVVDGGPQLVEVTRAGALVRGVSLVTQGISPDASFNPITGLAFDPAGNLFVSTGPGFVRRVNLNQTPLPAPTLAALTAAAAGGMPVDPTAASANVGQVIELTGTHFRRSDLQVVFPTRDNNGVVSAVAVTAAAISADGRRAQVVVPNQATTGTVTINSVGSSTGRNLSFINQVVSRPHTVGLHRDVTVLFTPSASAAQLTFAADEATPFYVYNGARFLGQTWGLDNVRVAPAAAPASVLFQDDFEASPNPAWSSPTIDFNDFATFGTFSGKFANKAQTLNLAGLQAGQSYRLQFDLYTFDEWHGTTPGKGADYFSVLADGLAVFHEAFSNSTGDLQTYHDFTAAQFPLQIVPVITGQTGRPGGDAYFTLQGSGFMQGDSTIAIGGTVLDQPAGNLANTRITGPQNETYQDLISPTSLDGPVRITTAGGSFQRSVASLDGPFAVFTGIQSVAEQGTPADGTQASANAGQEIVLNGGGFTNATLVQFTAIDDVGVVGTLTLTGSASNGGTSLSILVPAQGSTGPVRVGGATGSVFFQVVPTLRAVGGSLTLGSLVVLEGSGLAAGATSLAIDSLPVTPANFRTLSETGATQQLIDLTVPTDSDVGVMTVTTAGGTFTLTPNSITAIAANSTRGTPARTALPSANTGQSIILTGTGFRANDQVLFSAVDSFGRLFSSAVSPTGVAPDGTSLICTVPADATTGGVRLARETSGIILQVVPTLADIQTQAGSLTYPATFHGSRLYLYGTGFIEGGLTIHYGAQAQADTSVSQGPDIGFDFSTRLSGLGATVPASVPVGSISVSTAGGTSAPFGAMLSQVVATASSGTPANADLPSANPGQTITLQGSGFSTTTSLFVRTINDTGTVSERIVRPTMVSPDGATLTVVVPDDALTGLIGIVGDRNGTTTLLQIVPVVQSAQITGVQRARLLGNGLIEGNNTLYRFGSGVVVDAATLSSPTDVSGMNSTVDLALPVSGSGSVTVTTAGGTSAPIPWDVITASADFRLDYYHLSPGYYALDQLSGVAVAANGDLFTALYGTYFLGSSEIHRIDPATGNTVTLFLGPPAPSVGLQILPAAMTLGGVNVPAGSLLIFNNGRDAALPSDIVSPQQITVVDPETGARLAFLLIDDGDPLYSTSAQAGVFDPSTGRLFELRTGFPTDPRAHIHEIDTATGSILPGFAVPLTPDYYGTGGGLAIDPDTGNFWVGLTTSSQVLEVTRTGDVVRTVDLASQGIVSGEISGLAFNDRGQLLVSSHRGVVYLVNLSATG